MWPYIVTYQLVDPARHAPAIATVLRDLGAVALTDDAWLITSDWNACAILEQLRPIVGNGDKLLVLELGEDLAGLNIDPEFALPGEELVSQGHFRKQDIN